MSPSYVQLGSLSSLRSPRRFTARGRAHHWGCGRERCPHPLPSGTLRSGPRPSLTGRSTSRPLQVQPRPQPAVRPIHRLLPLQEHTGNTCKAPGKPCAALGKHPLPPASCYHHESHGSPGKAPSRGPTDGADYLGRRPSSSYN